MARRVRTHNTRIHANIYQGDGLGIGEEEFVNMLRMPNILDDDNQQDEGDDEEEQDEPDQGTNEYHFCRC